MKTDKKHLVKLSFEEAKKRFVVMSLPLSFFAIISIGVLVMAFFAPITLFLSVPFLIVPSFFSLAAINSMALNKNAHEGLGFFIMFRAYFTQFFRGCYKVIIGFLKAFAVFVISSVILSAILTTTILNNDPGFIEFQKALNSITDTNKMVELINNYMTNDKAFNDVLFVVNVSSFFLAFYVFVHHFSVNGIKYNYNFFAKLPLPGRDLNLIGREVLRKNRGKFYKTYFSLFWFLGLLLILGYAGGAVLSYFLIPNIDMVQATVVGMFGSLIVLLLFIPYYLCASELMFADYRTSFVDTLIDLSKKSLEEMKKLQTISEEKEKEVLKMIESQKEQENDKKDSDDSK